MRSVGIGMAAAACLIGAACTSGSGRSTAALDSVLRTAVEQKRVPGAVAAVATGGGPNYAGAAGFGAETIFGIASMTKPVTSVAAMQLVDAGKVKLDEPAATYLPELAKAQVLEGGKLRPPKSPVTVRQLLSHTSGFGYEFMNRTLADFGKERGLPGIMAGGDGFLQAPLLFDPGTEWEYGIGVDWLGKMVEKVSGQKLEQYFRQHIFDPLGMPDTTYHVPVDKQARIAAAFARQPDGGLRELPRQPFRPLEYGGMGLYSTAGDYLKFARALMTGEPRILSPDSTAQMGSNQIGALTVRPFRSLVPQMATDGAMLPGGLDKFGLGFALNSKAQDQGRGANTMSWAGIMNTFFWIDRERSVCGVLMTQMMPGLDEGPRRMLEEFDRAVYGWLR